LFGIRKKDMPAERYREGEKGAVNIDRGVNSTSAGKGGGK